MLVYRQGLPLPSGTVATPLAANLDAGGNKVTNLASGTASGDAETHGQVTTLDATLVHLAGTETVTGVKTFSVAHKVATYTVATLPAATVRQVAFVSDGRKTGEGGGSGTGTIAYADGTAWRRVADDSTVAA